jgi:hypothetical protein
MTVIHRVMYFGSQNPLAFAGAGLLLACALFWLRGRARVLYALVEIALGMLAVASATPRFTAGFSINDFSSDFALSETHWSLVTIAGALYFIIRGLDNLDRGLANVAQWRRLCALLRLRR